LNTTSRPTLILVPGLMCDHAVWDPLLPALAPVADCRIVDHGDADSLVLMAQRVLDAAPPRFAVAGHSMGGRVALEVVRQAPERVMHLGLLDTGYTGRAAGKVGDEEAAKRHALLDIARRDGVAAMAREWVQGMVAPARLQDAVLIDAIVTMFARRSAEGFAQQIRALLARPDATDVLRGLRVPTLLLCGREDSWSPPVQHEEMLQLAGAVAQLVVIAEAGHMSTMERPAEVAAALQHWIAG
jgi:pimeloyl-ACP methyl ester carboxylesterase